jgi:hypothetical protein
VAVVETTAPAAGTAEATGARNVSKPGNITTAQLMSMMRKPVAPVSSSGARGAQPAAAASTETNAEQAAEADGAQPDEAANEQAAEAEGAPSDVNDSNEDNAGGDSDVAAAEDGRSPEELPKGVRELQARVNKLTARAKAAEELVAKLRAPGSEGRAATADVAAAGDGRGPGPGHPELQRLDEQLGQYRTAIRFAEENPDGGEFADERGNKRFFDAAAIRAIRRNAEESRQIAIAERTTLAHQLRATAAAERARYESEATKAYPWLADPESPESIELREVFEQAPDLRRFPDATQWVADAIAGRKLRVEGAAKAAPKPGTPMRKPAGGSRTPPPVVSRPAAAAPKVTPMQRAVVEAEEAFKKSGKARDYSRLLSAQQAARSQPA